MNGTDEIKFRHLEDGRQEAVAPPRALKSRAERGRRAARGPRARSAPVAERGRATAIKYLKSDLKVTLDLAEPAKDAKAAPVRRPKSLNSIFKNYDADAENAIALIPATGGTM